MRLATFFGFFMLIGSWLQLISMETTTNKVIPSLKDMCVYHACTSEQFLQEFLADETYLVHMNVTKPYHESAQRVIEDAGIAHKLARTIRLNEWTSSNQDQIFNLGIIDIDTILTRRTTFTSPDQSRKAVPQLYYPHCLQIFHKTPDGRWQPMKIYQEHTKDVTDAAWSPDNQLLATFSAPEKKMIIWSTHTAKSLYTVDHPHQMMYLDKSPYWRDNATVVYPATQQNVYFNIPWLQATLNDALLLKALIKHQLTLEEKRAYVQRIENNVIQKAINRMVERDHQKKQYTQHKLTVR